MRSNNRGIALVLTMFVALLMLGLGLAVAIRAHQEVISAQEEYERMVAFNMAEGAIDIGRAIIIDEYRDDPKSWSQLPALIKERLNFYELDPGGRPDRKIKVESSLTLFPGYRAFLEVRAEYPVFQMPGIRPPQSGRIRLHFYPIDVDHPEAGLRADGWEQLR